MDERTLELLDFSRVLALASEACVSVEAKRKAISWHPSSEQGQVDRWLDETQEALRWMTEHSLPPFAGLREIDGILMRAQKESVLTAEDCLHILSSLESYSGIAGVLTEQLNGYEALTELAKDLVVHPRLCRQLLETFDEYGQIRDNATPQLARLRREINRLQERIKSSLESLLHRKETEKYLQDSLVTMRNDRYVIPVKAEYRHYIPGIVHDRSSTGQTLYIEPMLSVELNNDLQEAAIQEHDEVLRLLREITIEVARNAEELKNNARIAAYLDFVFARARLAERMHGIRAGKSDEQAIDMHAMRHPLLPAEQVVSVSLHVGETFRILVITGSNTGGKTVAIKTVGLLSAMNQAGFFVPAETGSKLPLFENIWAAIGDEQSLTENLSTFSGHMKRVIHIIEQSTGNDLVLLDELGTGTDPFEGAALAIAILDDFAQKGTLALATTHYSEVKQYVQMHEVMENAHVEFDMATLQPTYRLHIGVAGNSQALNISRRLGMPAQILCRAEELRKTSAYYDMERVVEQLNEQQKKLALLQENAARELDRAKRSHQRWDEQNRQLNERRHKIMEKVRDDARQLKRELRIETERIIKQLKQDAKQGENLQNAFSQARQAVEHIVLPQSNERSRIPRRKMSTGMSVYIEALHKIGVLQGFQGRNCQVRIDGMVVTVPSVQCFYPLPDEHKLFAAPKVSVRNRKVRVSVRSVSNELNIIGETVADAEIQIERFLDAAAASGLHKVDIIHGKGTGALRQGVHELLRRHPMVAEFRLADPVQGGSGVTVVTLR